MRYRRPAIRRRERFAQIVDGSRGDPADDPASDPVDDPELARLARIVAALRSVAPPARATYAPSTARNRHGGRDRRTVGQGGHTHRAPRSPRSYPVPGQQGQRRMLAWVGGFTLAVVTLVAALAAGEALPGDPFYGVKQAAQTATVTAATSERGRGQRELRIAQARLADIRELVRREDPHAGPAIERALRDIDARTRAGNAALTRAYRRTGDIRPLNVLDAFARDQRSRIVALLPALPWPARSRAQESLRLVERVGDRAVTMLARSCRTDASCRGTVQAAQPL